MCAMRAVLSRPSDGRHGAEVGGARLLHVSVHGDGHLLRSNGGHLLQHRSTVSKAFLCQGMSANKPFWIA
jgi:hypothetical protein